MKVLWLSQLVPWPPVGGAPQRSYHLLRAAAREHEVHLIALNQPRLLAPAAVPAALAALGEFCSSVTVHPLPSEASSLRRWLTLGRAALGPRAFDVVWLESARFAEEVARRERAGYDLLHVDTVGLWPYAEGWAATPRVLGHHNIESDLLERRAARERGVRRRVLAREASKLRALETTAAGRAQMNVVVSPLDRDRLLSLAPGARVEVVDNGVDTTFWRPGGAPVRDDTIVFAGTLGWYPNRDAVDFLLSEIWPRLARTRPGVELVLVGRDPPRSALDASDARVRVTGAVPDARPFIDAAGVYVCPIRVGGGTRLKVLDALAMAKPLVATALATEGLDLVPERHYLPAETADEFVRQIVRLQDDAGLRSRLGAAGREVTVERFDWSLQAVKLAAAYTAAVADSPARVPS